MSRIRVKLFYDRSYTIHNPQHELENQVNKWLENKPDHHIERVWFSFTEEPESTSLFCAVVYRESTKDDDARLPSPIGTILGS